MLRLLRTILGLLAINAACITLVIVTHYSESTLSCFNYQSISGASAVFDLVHGAYVTSPAPPTSDEVPALNAVDFKDFLVYDYLSPSNIHRIGVVATYPMSIHRYLDFAESPDFFARRESISPDQKYLVISTYDNRALTQSMTIYELPTLQPLVTAVQTDTFVIQIPQGSYNRFPPSWSTLGQWFAFHNLTTLGTTVTLMSPSQGLTYTFPLSGSINSVYYWWSPNDRALALGIGDDQLVDIFTTDADNWQVVKAYHLQTEVPHAALSPAYWSTNGQSLYLWRPQAADNLGHIQFHFSAFRLETGLLETAENEAIDVNTLVLKRQLTCYQNIGEGRSALFSVTDRQPPTLLTLLVDFGLTNDPCTRLAESPDHTMLIVPTQADTSAPIQWTVITSNPLTVTPLPLPDDVRYIVGWSPDSHKVLYFIPNTTTGDIFGRIGILDITTWHMDSLTYDIMLNLQSADFPSRYFSGDSTRFLMLAADQLHLLLFDEDGQFLAELPIAVPPIFLDVFWSPDNANFIVTEFNPARGFVVRKFNRDGQPSTQIAIAPEAAKYGYNGWSHCEPLPKFPRTWLPQ